MTDMQRHVITWVELTTRQVVFYTHKGLDPVKTFLEGADVDDSDIKTLKEDMVVVSCIPSP